MLYLSAATIAVVILSPTMSYGGPCLREINRTQTNIDSRIDVIAGAGKTAKQTVGAQLSHQPTPRSIAEAEAALGEDEGSRNALAALSKAREYDKIGKEKACRAAVKQAEQALRRK